MKPCKHPCCPDAGPCRKAKKLDSKFRTNRYSAKRQVVNRAYSIESKDFLKERPKCEIQSPVCTGFSEGVHHKKGRGKFLQDQSTWMSACNRCNQYIEEHDQWARDNGFKTSRLVI